MSVPRSSYDPRGIFRFGLPKLDVGPKTRAIGTYTAGGMFALSLFLLFDAATNSSHRKFDPEAPYEVNIHVTFVDWIPAICSCLGFLITAILDKTHLASYGSDTYGSEGTVAWRARVVLFIGIALMAGGVAGSLTVLILKYIIPGMDIFYGLLGVGCNAGIMLSAIILWVSQSGGDEYEYQLTV